MQVRDRWLCLRTSGRTPRLSAQPNPTEDLMTSTQSTPHPGATRTSRYRLPVGFATLAVGALLMSTSLPEPASPALHCAASTRTTWQRPASPCFWAASWSSR